MSQVVSRIHASRWIWINSYFSYFAFLGIYLAYLPVLLSAHYDKAQIGAISSVFILTRIVSPIFWGHIADTRAAHVALLRLKSVLAALSLVAMLMVWPHYNPLLLTTFLFGFFWSGTLPILEAVTIERLAGDAHQYHRVRLWGSVGFIVAILLMGVLMDMALSLPDVQLISWALVLAMALIVLGYLLLPRVAFVTNPAVTGSVMQLFRRRNVFVFLLVAVLMHMSHGVFYAFFSLHLEALGYSKSWISVYWVVGVIAEIFVFLQMQRWLRYWSAYAILLLCLAAAAVRWLLLGFAADSAFWVFVAQLLHSLTFGAFHLITMQFIRSAFPGQYQARAQSTFTMMCYGVGAALGTYFGGLAMHHAGASVAFSISAGQVFLALLITFTFLSRKSLQVFD